MNVNSQYELTIEKRSLYLYACVKCEAISREIVLDCLNKILAAFREGQYSRILLVNEIPSTLEPGEVAAIASEILLSGAQGMRIAIVDEVPEHDKVNRKGARKAKHVGLDVKFFTSFASAVHWLLHG